MMNMTISIIGYAIAVVMLAALIGGAAIRTNKKSKKTDRYAVKNEKRRKIKEQAEAGADWRECVTQ
ncbi:MAG: hypothetical protein LUI87_19215 [Lachnospiraceae bacterium]|nr:hypothetical protein [Lachnospiraceae bacterium]